MKTYIVYATDKLSIAITADGFEKDKDSITFANYDLNLPDGRQRVAVFNLNNIIGVTEG